MSIVLRVDQEAALQTPIILWWERTAGAAVAMARGSGFPIMPATLPLTAAHRSLRHRFFLGLKGSVLRDR